MNLYLDGAMALQYYLAKARAVNSNHKTYIYQFSHTMPAPGAVLRERSKRYWRKDISMNYVFENIQFNSDIPIKIFVHNLNYVQNHWHDALEILFILDGNIQIGIGNAVYQLQREDLIVINPHEIHTTYAKSSNLVLILQISSEWINKYPAYKDIRLSCNSCIGERKLHMDIIRKLLAQMMWVYNNQSTYFELKLQSYLFELLYQLFTYFQAEKQKQAATDNNMPRLFHMIQYLHENYDKNITLQELANKEFLSVAYLSRFFKKHMGTSFKDYVIRLRLEPAVKDLLYTDKSIVQIAYDNGFPNTNSFLFAFKETYQEAPSIYRKKSKADYTFLYGPKVQTNNYFQLGNTDFFQSLYKYLNLGLNPDIRSNSEEPVEINLGEADLTQRAGEVTRAWRNLITIGKAKDALDPRVQAQLTMVQKEIGFRYIRFHGIFDDEMMVYKEDEQGKPLIDFTYIDQVIDFLYSIHLKPFIELGFMPAALARDNHTVFQCRKSIISMPKDIHKWNTLVEQFVRHCMERYGKEKVEDWYFEFWNEPEMAEVFWYDTEEEYLFFYYNTYQTIRSISGQLRIGGPAVCITSVMEEWLKVYFEFCSAKNCLPDFFTYHFYLLKGDLLEVQNCTHAGSTRVTLSENPDYMLKIAERMAKLIEAYGYRPDRIHMTEWNAGPSHRDLSHDTLYMASYVVKSVTENMASFASMGFWTITDLIEEYPLPEECFHGGMGMITSNGIKKAGYYALQLLRLLGDTLIASGPGYYITSDSNGYQILLYNYIHFDKLYCSMDHSGISYVDRYGIYKDSSSKSMKLTLHRLNKSNYIIKEYTVSRSHGSAFDAWVAMGAPTNMTSEIVDYIKSTARPRYVETQELIQGSYQLQCDLEPHEIRLINLKPAR